MAALSQELGYLARRQLAVLLDHESPLGRDWMGLADTMQFPYSTVLALKSERSPTMTLLEEWEGTAGSEATLTRLMSLLDSLECKEAVNILMEEKAKISRKYDTCAEEPESLEDITTQCLTSAHNHSNSQGEENQVSRTAELQQRKTTSDDLGPDILHMCRKKYDVFLSYAEEDMEFAEEMRRRLIEHTKLRIFVPSDGLMPGKVFHEEVADMIKRGCGKTVVILSPSYITSPWCKYEANLAIMASPDTGKHVLIPVLYRECEVPAFLTPLYYADYPRHKHSKEACEKYFWQRLYKSLTYVPREVDSSDRPVTRDPPRQGRGQSDRRPLNYGPRHACTSDRPLSCGPQAQQFGPKRPLNYGPQAQGSMGVPSRQPLNYEPRKQGQATGAPEQPLNYGPRTQGRATGAPERPLNYGPRTQGRVAGAPERPLNYGNRTQRRATGAPEQGHTVMDSSL